MELSENFFSKLKLSNQISKNNFVGCDKRCYVSNNKKYNWMTQDFLNLRGIVSKINDIIENNQLQGVHKYCKLENELTEKLAAVCLNMAITNNK